MAAQRNTSNIDKIYPTTWGAKYSDKDKADVCHIITWLNDNNRSSTWLSQAANVNRTTQQLILQGSYTGRVSSFLKPMLQAIKNIESRKSIAETPYIPSSVNRMVTTACQRARKYCSFSVVTAEVGLGKTRAAREYTAEHTNTLMLDGFPQMSPSSLLNSLMHWLHIDCGNSRVNRERKLELVMDELKKIDALIILDEAETVSPRTLEHLRRIHDISNVGVVLTGTAKLHMLISPVGGQFDQIRSRTGFWPQPMRTITQDDARAVLYAAFTDQPAEIDEATIKAFWQHGRGSMRMLVEVLIPAVRDYGLKKHELSADLVHKVAKDVLSLG